MSTSSLAAWLDPALSLPDVMRVHGSASCIGSCAACCAAGFSPHCSALLGALVATTHSPHWQCMLIDAPQHVSCTTHA